MNNELQDALQAAPLTDHTDPKFQAWVQQLIGDAATKTARAVRLFYAVRDGWRYNPYRISFREEDWKLSTVFAKSEAHCIDKAVILIAAARVCHIPARLHLVKVKNHIAVEQLTAKFGTNVLTPHGFVELYLTGAWRKVTPAFNKSLCDKLGVAPMEFDGEQDCVFQEYDRAGGKFMEYLDDYGTFNTLPVEFMRENMSAHYPILKDLITKRGVLQI